LLRWCGSQKYKGNCHGHSQAQRDGGAVLHG
jgi:hypothetical protein